MKGMGSSMGGSMPKGPRNVAIEAANNGYIVSAFNPKTGREHKAMAKTMGAATKYAEGMFKHKKKRR